jgi:hypothetical protein
MLNKLPVPQDRVLFLAYRGSIAREMSTPESDLDYIGAYIETLDHYFGNDKTDNHNSNVDKIDYIIYELRKYINLLAAANPNILESLWTDDKYFLHNTEIFDTLRKNRNLFATKQVYHTFSNYAKQQMHRMESMTKDLVDEIDDLELCLLAEGIDIKELSPKQAERDRFITVGKYKHRKIESVIQRYVEIKKKHLTGGGRLGEKRKNLIKKFHYDVKNASILVLLLKQAIEFLNTGELLVDRSHDKDELLSIKNGQWTLDEVKIYVDKLSISAKIAYQNSSLPESADYEKIQALMVRLIKQGVTNYVAF